VVEARQSPSILLAAEVEAGRIYLLLEEEEEAERIYEEAE
jgi:hypothetical protein